MSPSVHLALQAKICHEIVYNSLLKMSKISLSALDHMRFVGGVILNGCGLKFSHTLRTKVRSIYAVIMMSPGRGLA